MARKTSNTGTKTDNASLVDKIAIRQAILDEAGFESLEVLDLCAGLGHIWSEMGKLRAIERYVPCDVAPRMPGVIKGEMEQLVQALDLSRFNVIDVDTYGEPWAGWLTVASRIERRTAVFLTDGMPNNRAVGGLSTLTKRHLGLPGSWQWSLTKEVIRYASEYMLQVGLQMVRPLAVKCVRLENVVYYGALCDPLTE